MFFEIERLQINLQVYTLNYCINFEIDFVNFTFGKIKSKT